MDVWGSESSLRKQNGIRGVLALGVYPHRGSRQRRSTHRVPADMHGMVGVRVISTCAFGVQSYVKQRGRLGAREESVAQFTSAAKYTSGACGNKRHSGGKGHIYMHVWDSVMCKKRESLLALEMSLDRLVVPSSFPNPVSGACRGTTRTIGTSGGLTGDGGLWCESASLDILWSVAGFTLATKCTVEGLVAHTAFWGSGSCPKKHTTTRVHPS